VFFFYALFSLSFLSRELLNFHGSRALSRMILVSIFFSLRYDSILSAKQAWSYQRQIDRGLYVSIHSIGFPSFPMSTLSDISTASSVFFLSS